VKQVFSLESNCQLIEGYGEGVMKIHSQKTVKSLQMIKQDIHGSDHKDRSSIWWMNVNPAQMKILILENCHNSRFIQCIGVVHWKCSQMVLNARAWFPTQQDFKTCANMRQIHQCAWWLWWKIVTENGVMTAQLTFITYYLLIQCSLH